MGVKEDVINMARNNNGIVTTAMIVEAGYSRGNIKYLCEKGIIEKSARGVYTLPEVWEDEIYNLQNRFKKGIYSHETALFLFDLTDRTPNRYHMTFPSTYNLSNPKEADVKCSQCIEDYYELGITEVTTPGGNKVLTYNVERTLCDILRKVSYTDIQIVAEAYKRYMNREDKNVPLLSEYAKKLKVDDKLKSYLEVLL